MFENVHKESDMHRKVTPVRYIGIIAIVCSTLMALWSGPQSPQARAQSQAGLDIYTDDLASGWQSTSWGATVAFDNSSPIHDDDASLAITYTNGSGWLHLTKSQPI